MHKKCPSLFLGQAIRWTPQEINNVENHERSKLNFCLTKEIRSFFFKFYTPFAGRKKNSPKARNKPFEVSPSILKKNLLSAIFE